MNFGNNTPYGQGRGEAASYFTDGDWQQQQYPPQGPGGPGYGRGQAPFSPHGQPGFQEDGERGVLGAVGGGLAGGVGGHALGGRTSHGRLGSTFLLLPPSPLPPSVPMLTLSQPSS